MRFDVVIGNPPYQLSDAGAGASSVPIYHRFVELAKALAPRLIAFVIPARWYSGGKGLRAFRRSMLEEGGIRELHDFPDTSHVFPGVNARGGVCWFLWERGYRGDTAVSTHERGRPVSLAVRPLLEPGHDSFIRHHEGVEILRKVLAVEGRPADGSLTLAPTARFASLVSARNPFGIPTGFRGGTGRREGVPVHRARGTCLAEPSDITDRAGLLESWKLLVPRASPGSDSRPHLVLSPPIVAAPGTAATDTYVAIGPFSDQLEAERAAAYMGTVFFRFMLELVRTSINVTRGVYRFAPLQPLTRVWSDRDLALKYALTDADTAFMRRFVRPVAWAGERVP